MVNQTDTLERLNKEKEYEDRLVDNLTNYFLYSLDAISDLAEEQREKVKESLGLIAHESRKHSYMFNNLVQMVVENGENNY